MPIGNTELILNSFIKCLDDLTLPVEVVWQVRSGPPPKEALHWCGLHPWADHIIQLPRGLPDGS